MDKVQKGVQLFHEKYGCLTRYKPTMPDPQTCLLRASLIIEEAAEFMSAARNRNMEGMCDALADLLYVTYGAAVVMGVDMEPISDEVQRSNMTKDGGGKDSGGKIMKGPNFKKPDIAGILEKMKKILVENPALPPDGPQMSFLFTGSQTIK